MSTTAAGANSNGVRGALFFILTCFVVIAGVMAVWPFFALVAAIAIAIWAAWVCHQRAMSDAALALHWLGAAVSLGWTIGANAYQYGLSIAAYLMWRPPTGAFMRIWFERSSWIGAAVIVGSAIVVALIRRSALTGTEIAIYALGCLIALAWVLVVHFGV